MHYTAAMRFVQSVRNLRAQFQHLLQHQVIDSVLMTDVVQYANVWMIQLRDRFRFALEPLLVYGISGELRRQNLDRDGPVKACVACTIHLSHPARSKRRNDLVRPESGAGGQCHSSQIIPAEIKYWRQLFVLANERGILSQHTRSFKFRAAYSVAS